TPMYLAARAGHVDIIQILIGAGADVDATKTYGYHSGITGLHAAAARGNVKAVTALLDAGTNVNLAASDGGTALHCAAEYGNAAVVKALLEHQKDGKRVCDV
ncbi:hypothetical protein CAPTEDRAFT_28184, partial [Capitella teleta]